MFLHGYGATVSAKIESKSIPTDIHFQDRRITESCIEYFRTKVASSISSQVYARISVLVHNFLTEYTQTFSIGFKGDLLKLSEFKAYVTISIFTYTFDGEAFLDPSSIFEHLYSDFELKFNEWLTLNITPYEYYNDDTNEVDKFQ